MHSIVQILLKEIDKKGSYMVQFETSQPPMSCTLLVKLAIINAMSRGKGESLEQMQESLDGKASGEE